MRENLELSESASLAAATMAQKHTATPPAVSPPHSQADEQAARLTILISGSGSNLQALIDSCGSQRLPDTKIVRVISDRKDAYGLKRAEAAGIPHTHHGILKYKKEHPDTGENPQFQAARRAYDTALADLAIADKPDLVVCAGFMRILTPAFLDKAKASGIPVVNLHPSLHKDLVGAGCIQRAWAEFEQGERSETGIMIHYVIEQVDMGQHIVVRDVELRKNETLKQLEERFHSIEHEAIVEGTKIALERLGG